MDRLYFLFTLLALLTVPVAVVLLVIRLTVGRRNNRRYLQHETEEYERQVAEADLPREPYE